MPEPGVVRSLTPRGDRPPLELVLQTRCRFAVYVHGFPCGSGYVTCPTYCGKSSVISYHGAREPTKIWAFGWIDGGSTSVPMATWTKPPSRTTDQSSEPQRLQCTSWGPCTDASPWISRS